MVQKFRMPKYVNIWRSNEKGNKDELLRKQRWEDEEESVVIS